ncbi:hypothetical protein Bhyg_08765 [Pseudolycoriella hygida]|uniref:Uncharacterized protein n=1 Tax=Pseudolycoriella hygida TaxID=35572 RepID=A0A9Q0S596_9DIPT|nr:hypothetical protein Bhyg_08765 [Pseudolycoriella hygida]
MARYEVSSLGRLFVIDEHLNHLPITRQIFAVVTAILGIVTLTRFLIVLNGRPHSSVSSLRVNNLYRTIGGRVILVYIVSHVIHTLHYVDNICRPVAYFEPKWLYQKYLISEMEITFFANFPITLSGLYFMERIVSGINGEKFNETSRACRNMVGYILGSLLTLGHYRTEPPWKYEPFVNFTIAGEGVATILLAVLLYRLRNDNFKRAKGAADLDVEQTTLLLEEEQGHINMNFPGMRSRTPVKI